MKFTHFSIKKVLLFVSVFFAYTSLSFALVTCPGRPNAALEWSSSNVAVSGCSLEKTAPSACDFDPAPDISGIRSITNGNSCTVTLSCVKNGSTLATDTDTLTYDANLAWNGSMCATPTGTLTATACTVASNASSCSTTVTTNVTPDTSNVNLYLGPTLWVNRTGDGNNSGTLNYSGGAVTVYLKRIDGTQLASVQITPTCASGTVWNGSVCAPSSVSGSISASLNPCLIANGASSCSTSVSWNTSGTTNHGVFIGGVLWASGAGPKSGTISYGSPVTLDLRNGTSGGTSPTGTLLGSITISASCASGTSWNSTSGTCVTSTSPSCPSQSVTWLTNCTGSLSSGSSPQTINDNTTGYTGSATYTCNSGTWSSPSSATCTQDSTETTKTINVSSADDLTTTPSTSFTETFNVTANPSGHHCRLLDNAGNQLVSYVSGSPEELTYTSPSAIGDYLYTVQCRSAQSAGRVYDTDSFHLYVCLSGQRWNTSTNQCVPAPDLVSGAVTPVSVTEDVSTTFRAPITNVGTVSTGVSFYNTIQWTSDNPAVNSTPSINSLTSASMSALAAGATATTSASRTFGTSGTYYMRACADYASGGGGWANTNLVDEGTNDNNNCGTWTTVTVTAPAPDLVAGGIHPQTATAGVSTSLSSRITNQGNLTTGASFYNFIQVANQANGGGTITNLTRVSMSTLAAGAGATTSRSYTFPANGIYSARACADKDSPSDTGDINEGSNEGNNCGSPWTTITVGNVPCALPWGGTINSGQSVTAYNMTSATYPDICTNHDEIRTCTGGVLSGSYTFQSCTDIPAPSAEIQSFNITPRTIPEDGLIKLTWIINNPTTSCQIVPEVQMPASCNASCQALRSAEEDVLIDELTTGYTNANDPYGSRLMTTALQTAASGTTARGEKSVRLKYSTSFTASCGTAFTPVKTLIYVTEKTEG